MSQDACPGAGPDTRSWARRALELRHAADDLAWSAATVSPDPHLAEPLRRALHLVAEQLHRAATDLEDAATTPAALTERGGAVGAPCHPPAAR